MWLVWCAHTSHNAEGNHCIYVMNADGSAQTELTHHRLEGCPDWHPILVPQRTTTQRTTVANLTTASAVTTSAVGWPFASTESLLITLVVTICPVAYFLGRRSRRAVAGTMGSVCGKCGCKLPINATFCDACGTRQVTE